MKNVCPYFHLSYRFIVFFVFAFILFPEISNSQDLLTSRRSSYYTFICKLNDNDAEKLIRENKIDFDERLLQTVVDSFPTDSQYTRILSPGNYLFMHVSKNQLRYKYLNISTFDINVLNNNRDLIIEVYDKETSAIIPDAIVKFNDRNIRFDDRTKTYILPKHKKDGSLKIQLGNETLFKDVEFGYYRKPPFLQRVAFGFPLKYVAWPIFNSYRRVLYGKSDNSIKYLWPKAKGYIAFNKPKYLPGDTVKVKAFIVGKHGKAFNGKVKLLLKESRLITSPSSELIEMWPTVSGSYIYQFPLADTLRPNRNYGIVIVDAKTGKPLLYDRFPIEDYQLDEIRYEVRKNKETTYQNGEPVMFYASGKDANGLNVLDGNIGITIKTSNTNRFYGESVFVPNTLWEHQQRLDPVGETKISVPDSVFPRAAFSAGVSIKFKNSNNEIHEKSFWFKYDGKQKVFDITIRGDTLHCGLYGKYKQQGAQGVYTAFNNRDTLSVRQITFPFHEKTNTNATRFVFAIGDTAISFDPSEIEDSISTYHYQEGDTIYFGLVNPRRLNVRYNIYKDMTKEVEKGNCKQLDWFAHNPEKASYSISYQYKWAGMEKNIKNNIYSYGKNLDVKISQPRKIDPGQKVNVEIDVSDINDEPVEGVNLTAGAITAKFERKGFPNLPYFGKPIKSDKYYDYVGMEKPVTITQKNLTDYDLSRFNMDTITWYKMMYPENGIYYNYDSTDLNNAQFFAHLRKGNYPIEIKMIYIDDELVYYSGANNSYSGYSIIVKEGFHHIKIRARTRVYTLDSILFKKGFKLDLSLDVNNLPKNVKTKKTVFKLSEDEKALLKQKMIWVKNNFRGGTAYLWQGNKVYSFNYSHSRYYLLGPFNNDTIHFAVKDYYQRTFIPEFGQEYTIEKDQIKITEQTNNQYFNWYKSFTKNNIDPGQMAFPISAVKLVSEKSKCDSFEFSPNKRIESESMGELKIRYSGDSIFQIARLICYNDGYKPKYFSGRTTKFNGLEKGYYQLSLITGHSNVLVKDSILIQAQGVNYYLLGGDFKNLSGSFQYGQQDSTKSAWQGYLPSIHLNPIVYDPRGNSAISGKVFDSGTHEPIPFANVVLESHE
ncbi:MAG: hypothetical protein DRJ05_13040, partial [Bacteroidetes bacterium]